ncbi:MAG: ATP-dependent helicase [Deltaproteobacteria bacterium]|jgi:DNA helicase-2/ATP-dependent DNA helicase PcrA|nr:ATP-dependent helicase [Deltaproteobacteria bacterium]
MSPGYESKGRLDLKSLLNPAQYQAAVYDDGPLLIIAGAGSGKTRTLVFRVAHLVEEGYAPSSILLLTFTRKAAAEMLNRCVELVGVSAGRVSGGTFHSTANSILRHKAHLLGYDHNFRILDQDDAESLAGRIRTSEVGKGSHDGFPKKNTILNLISQAANRDYTVKQLILESYYNLRTYATALDRIAEEYKKIKKESNVMDFDDLLVNLEFLLRNNESERLEIASQFSHILVDEYQDTNPIQARITGLLGRDHLKVTAVGDEAQSIYSFRGATIANIMDFPRLFPQTKILKLEDNYRSLPGVLKLANYILRKAKIKYEKQLNANREGGPKPRIIVVDNVHEEAQIVVKMIRENVDSGLCKLSDIAVLFRNGSHSFELESLLNKYQIAYSKFGGRKFLESAHNKDFISLIHLIVNPRDWLSLSRILNLISGLGPKGVEKIIALAMERQDYWCDFSRVSVTSKAKDGLKEFFEVLSQMHKPTLSPPEKVQLAYDYYTSVLLKANYRDDYHDRLVDLKEILNMFSRVEDLNVFLNEITLDPPNTLRSGGAIDSNNREDLTLSTVHSAKGLEWPVVIIISAVEGRFPSFYNQKDTKLMEEELRLMYVAVTRAKDLLIAVMPRDFQQSSYGLVDPTFFPTRFFQGLSEETVDVFADGIKQTSTSIAALLEDSFS